MTIGAKFTTLDYLNQGHKAEDFPGLEEMAQQTYEIPFVELAPNLQKDIRERVKRMAADDMLTALRNIAETANDTTARWEARLYQIKRYSDAAIARGEGRK